MKRTDEIGKLCQTIARRPDGICELYSLPDTRLENLMEHTRYRGLSAVIVYLDAAKLRYEITMPRDKFREVGLEPFEYLSWSVYELLVDAQTMVFAIHFPGKGHHAREDAPSKLTAEHRVVLLASDERSRMKAMPLKPDFLVRTFKSGYFGGNVDGLIMEYHAYDVEAGIRIGDMEIPRFVYKNTQNTWTHCTPQKRKWRDMRPATHAETFPRIPVTPARRRRSVRIVAHSQAVRKGVR